MWSGFPREAHGSPCVHNEEYKDLFIKGLCIDVVYLSAFRTYSVGVFSPRVFNRPCVAGAVLQTALSLTDLLINSLTESLFVKISLPCRHAQRLEMVLAVVK